MESAFSWLGKLMETLHKLIPHILIIPSTHSGVKWVRGGNIRLLAPGLHFYWPLTIAVEVIVTARQTLAIPDQVMATNDGKKLVVKTLVVYRIPDPVRAIGKLNWDVDTTIHDAIGRGSRDCHAQLRRDHGRDQGRIAHEDPDQGDPPRVAAVRRPRHPLQAGGLR